MTEGGYSVPPCCRPHPRSPYRVRCAHLDASLRWHDGGALLRSAEPSPSSLLSPPCALSRTWMPAFAGMTEGGLLRSAEPSPSSLLSPPCALSRTLDASLRWHDGGGATPFRRAVALILALPTVCAVAHLDASLRWHDGGGLLRSAEPSPSPRSPHRVRCCAPGCQPSLA